MSDISVDLITLKKLRTTLQETELQLAQKEDEIQSLKRTNSELVKHLQDLNEDYDDLNIKYRNLVNSCLRIKEIIFQLKNDMVTIIDDQI